MTATLSFQLPEESTEHKLAVNGAEIAYQVRAVDQQLRNWLKHGHEFKTADEAITATREMLREAVELAGV